MNHYERQWRHTELRGEKNSMHIVKKKKNLFHNQVHTDNPSKKEDNAWSTRAGQTQSNNELKPLFLSQCSSSKFGERVTFKMIYEINKSYGFSFLVLYYTADVLFLNCVNFLFLHKFITWKQVIKKCIDLNVDFFFFKLQNCSDVCAVLQRICWGFILFYFILFPLILLHLVHRTEFITKM